MPAELRCIRFVGGERCNVATGSSNQFCIEHSGQMCQECKLFPARYECPTCHKPLCSVDKCSEHDTFGR